MRNLLPQLALAAYLAVHLGGPAWHGWAGHADCRHLPTGGANRVTEHPGEDHHAEDCHPSSATDHATSEHAANDCRQTHEATACPALHEAVALGASPDECGLCQFLAQAPLRAQLAPADAVGLAPVGRVVLGRSSLLSCAPLVALARGPPLGA